MFNDQDNNPADPEQQDWEQQDGTIKKKSYSHSLVYIDEMFGVHNENWKKRPLKESIQIIESFGENNEEQN